MTKLMTRSIFATVLLVVMAACGEEPEVVQEEKKLSPPEELQTALWPGPWRLTIELQGRTLPLQMEVVEREDGVPAVYYINGEERVKVPRVEIDGNDVLLEMTAFDTRIIGKVRDGVLEGELHKQQRSGTQVMPVRAEYGEQYRFFQTMAPPEAELGGRWAVTFTDDEGNETEAVAEFEQEGTQIEGTFLTPTGDYRFLAGEVRNGQLFLSTYDGAHVFLFEAFYDQVEDRLSGDFWSGAAWHENWVAERDPEAALPDAGTLTYLREGYDRFEFTFPDLEGKPVSLDGPQFDDKVVVVQLAGSWCPNCGDETRFLAPWYEENRDRGVEVIALMFEYYEDFDVAAEQVRKWRDEFGVEYTTLIAGTSEKEVAGEALPQLNAVLAYPTTIFIDRDGKVRRIHTGFSGPGAGERHEKLVRSFNHTVDTLLDE